MRELDYEQIEALNWSALRAMAESPLAYQWHTEHERPDTAAFLRGRAVHCAVLELEQFAQRYYALPERPPEADGRAKKDTAEKRAHLDWKAACEAARVPGATELSASDMSTVRAVTKAIDGHAAAKEALRGRHEVVVTWIDEDTGTACKGRLDALLDYVTDLKTTSKPLAPGLVATEIARRLYHGQLAYYHDGAIAAGLLPADAPEPRIVMAQTVAPYDVAVYELDRDALRAGRALYRSLLRRLQECQQTDWWPGVAPDPVRLSLPAWAPGMAEAQGYVTDWSWADDIERERKSEQ